MSRAGSSPESTNTDTEAVRDVLRRAYAAWADNDADAFAALYTDDATVVMPGVFRKAACASWGTPRSSSAARSSCAPARAIPPTTPTRAVTATWVLARTAYGWKIAAYANAPASR